MTAIEGLQTTLNGLGLKAVEARLENLLEQASKKEPSYADFLQDLLSCGVGKTHLSVSLAEAAIQSGFGAYFMTAHDLVNDLGRAYREGRLDRRMRVYLAPKVLIIDEMGYLPLDDLGATIFFQLVSARYERGSIILTSNKSYGDWGSVFGDPIIATAILDRLLHHSTTINIRGESYRLKDRKKAGLFPRPDDDGNRPAPFPPNDAFHNGPRRQGSVRGAKPARP